MALSSKPFSIRPLREGSKERWKRCADEKGVSLNKWINLGLNAQADLDEVEARERSEQIAERERQRKLAFPQGERKCKHVQKGQFCYQCGATRW